MSGITFSGYNSIDWNSILNAVMQQESQPLTRLETQKETLETQNSAFDTLAGKLSTLESAVDDLTDADSIATVSAQSSSSNVGVSAGSATVTGSYAIVVSELARAQVLGTSTTYSSLDDVVATSGTLTLTPSSGDPVTITISESTTIGDLAKAINNEDDSPVSASVVQSTPGVYRLVLTSKETGVENGFTVSSTLSGGTAPAFTDTDGDGVSGDDTADVIQAATNAEFTVNGLAVVSSSNTVEDVVPGVTLSLMKKDPTETVTVEVTRNNDDAKALIDKFISAYNDIVAFAKDQDTENLSGKASIAHDPLMRSLRNGMRQALLGAYDEGGEFSRLAQVGIGFDVDGNMTLDEDVFDEAIESSPSSVQTLLSGADGDGGAFGSILELVKRYTDSDGLVNSTQDRIGNQIDGLDDRLDDMEARLAVRRASLQKEYLAADQLMTQLSSSASSLSSLGDQYRLF